MAPGPGPQPFFQPGKERPLATDPKTAYFLSKGPGNPPFPSLGLPLRRAPNKRAPSLAYCSNRSESDVFREPFEAGSSSSSATVQHLADAHSFKAFITS